MYGFTRNGTPYYYKRDLQGDVMEVLDAEGTCVAYYYYDMWGALLSGGSLSGIEIDIATINPIRYRGYYYDTETGFYYLNSRYYDPTACRFINADTITDGKAGLLGYNLFVYAANDPINNVDPSGRWIVKKAIKWVAKNVIRSAVKKAQEALSAINATYSRGVNISGSPSAFIFNLQGGVSVDTKGNVALQGSFAGGVTGGSPGASITTYQMVTNAQSIKKLEDAGYQMGGSMGIPVYGVPIATGGDFNIIPDTELNKTYLGVTSNVGVGTPGIEFHVEWGETATWRQTQFNVFDSAKTIYVKIMEW